MRIAKSNCEAFVMVRSKSTMVTIVMKSSVRVCILCQLKDESILTSLFPSFLNTPMKQEYQGIRHVSGFHSMECDRRSKTAWQVPDYRYSASGEGLALGTQ